MSNLRFRNISQGFHTGLQTRETNIFCFTAFSDEEYSSLCDGPQNVRGVEFVQFFPPNVLPLEHKIKRELGDKII